MATSGGVDIVARPGGWATCAGVILIAGGAAFGSAGGIPTFGAANGEVPPGQASLVQTLAPMTLSATVALDVQANLSATLAPMTLASTATTSIQANLSATLGAMTLASTATNTTPFRNVVVDIARFSDLPLDWELGTAGSQQRGKYITVGTASYVWWSHVAPTPSGNVATGYDPIVFETALSGMTGYECPLPAGTVSAQDHATLLATTFASIPGVDSAVARSTANADGTWSVDVETLETVSWGTRDYASRGAAGLQGGHLYRIPDTGEATGWLSINITRPIASRITAPAAGSRVWAVQIALGTTVGTGGTARPRLQYWRSNSDTTPAGTETFDFGQLPVAQVQAGTSGTIFLTPAQVAAFASFQTAATGTRHWIEACATTGTEYIGAATGTGYGGQQINANIRVETVGSNNPTSALTTWSSSGELNFAFLLGGRLAFEIDPCTDLEYRSRWGSLAAYATYPSDVVLPDTVTGQRGDVTGMEGARILSMTIGVVAGQVRGAVFSGGTQTPDAPSMIGATQLWDAGVSGGTGAYTWTAPTGSGVVRVPASGGLWLFGKGFGATGRGQLGPGPFANTGRPDQPSTWIRRYDTGGLRGQNPGERDVGRTAPGYGDDTTPFQSPITDPNATEYGPDNHPFWMIETGTPAIPIT